MKNVGANLDMYKYDWVKLSQYLSHLEKVINAISSVLMSG